ncbi:MAG: VOC family protein [Chloroflexi bacterium]|nr:VOC family protein [Chloroflexota bacterium]
MFLGLRTVIYHPGDLDKTKAWYQEALGIAPYFDEPFYVGFEVGGYELGLDPGGAPPSADAGVSAYWGVENIEAAHQRLLELGATAHDPIADVGDGIKVASVVDPFGNRVGIIENPHFKVK